MPMPNRIVKTTDFGKVTLPARPHPPACRLDEETAMPEDFDFQFRNARFRGRGPLGVLALAMTLSVAMAALSLGVLQAGTALRKLDLAPSNQPEIESMSRSTH